MTALTRPYRVLDAVVPILCYGRVTPAGTDPVGGTGGHSALYRGYWRPQCIIYGVLEATVYYIGGTRGRSALNRVHCRPQCIK